MSLPPSGQNYVRKMSLVDRTVSSPVTYIGTGILDAVENNLDEFYLKSEVTNTGNSLTDNARFTFRIPPDGTFIRIEPILVDENAKTKYLLQFTIDQGGDSTKIFRMEISQAIIQEDEKFGEVLVMVGRGREYVMKENVSSRPLQFRTPFEAFDDRINDFAANPPGGDGAQPGNVSNNLPGELPEEDSLSQDWIPSGPIPVQRLMQDILDRVALPGTSGGVLRDFYMDADSTNTDITFFDIIVEEFGRLPILDADRVIISPEDFLTAAEQKDKTVVTDSVIFKNQIVLKGSPSKGSLPMNYVRHASNFEHARRRPEWINSKEYQVGSLVKRTIAPAVTGEQDLSRYFKCKILQGVGPNPIPESDATDWEEDFTIYPEFIPNGTYEKGDIIYDNDTGTINFYQCNTDEAASSAFSLTITIPALNANFDTFANGQADTNFTEFVPPSPWTTDADLWLANMTESPETGYRGGFVDWNFIRTVYDRTNFDNEFERIIMK